MAIHKTFSSMDGDKVIDYLDVPIITGFALGVGFTNGVEMTMKILSLAIAIGYSTWRWYTEYRKNQRELDKELKQKENGNSKSGQDVPSDKN